MYLEIPKKLAPLEEQAHMVAEQMFRPISRKYDRAEHEYPVELDMLAALLEGMGDGGGMAGAGAGQTKREKKKEDGGVRNGGNMATVIGLTEMCWGDVGLALSIPRQGLGNAAIAAVANEEQLERFKGHWAAMAITEPDAGSDSGAIRTTARLDGDHYVLERREDLHHRRQAARIWSSCGPHSTQRSAARR